MFSKTGGESVRAACRTEAVVVARQTDHLSVFELRNHLEFDAAFWSRRAASRWVQWRRTDEHGQRRERGAKGASGAAAARTSCRCGCGADCCGGTLRRFSCSADPWYALNPFTEDAELVLIETLLDKKLAGLDGRMNDTGSCSYYLICPAASKSNRSTSFWFRA